MTEISGFPGQIMHTSTAEKILQPAEHKGDLTDQMAQAVVAEKIEKEKLSVQESQETNQENIREKQGSESGSQNTEYERGEDGNTESADEKKASSVKGEQLIDVIV